MYLNYMILCKSSSIYLVIQIDIGVLIIVQCKLYYRTMALTGLRRDYPHPFTSKSVRTFKLLHRPIVLNVINVR
jgi:hypothetical protein